MSTPEEIKFEEKQYLGHNKMSGMVRTLLAICCFLGYYYSNENVPLFHDQRSSEFLFMTGLFIMVVSLGLVFVLHLHTKVQGNSVILDGLWTARKVKIDLGSIVSAEVIPYSKYRFNKPVYNLHRRGKIRFFTRGNECVELIDKDGLKYHIGSQKPSELAHVIQGIIQPQD